MWRQVSRTNVDAFTGGEQIAFRATAFREGRDQARQAYTSDQLAVAVGGGVNNAMHWTPRMNGYDLEVIVHVVNDELTIGIALRNYAPEVRHYSFYKATRSSGQVRSKDAVLSKRNRTAMGETTLLCSIAYGLLHLAHIQPGDIVLDPMGGVGTICVGACFEAIPIRY